MSRGCRWAALATVAWCVACGGGRAVTVDAGFDAGNEVDAGQPDAGPHDAGAPDAGAADAGPPDAGPPDAGASRVDGIVFVHGIKGSGNDWKVMRDRFIADGWSASRLIAETFADPSWGCNTTNASRVSSWVAQLKADGAQRIAIVAHSMGGLSSRHYLKALGGTADVAVFVTLGTMHHGLSSPCLSPLPVCVWQELCESGAFIAALNAAPATPGPTAWTSIFSTDDGDVPVKSSTLQGANNIQLMGITHSGSNGLQDSAVVYQHVVDAL